jgi:hypothetical protein
LKIYTDESAAVVPLADVSQGNRGACFKEKFSYMPLSKGEF